MARPQPEVTLTHIGSPTICRKLIDLQQLVSHVPPGLLILGIWVFLFGPYILNGGFVRDDYGYLPQLRGDQHYIGWSSQPRALPTFWDFQAFVIDSGFEAMRPLGALLHALAYWIFRATSWPLHLLNLGLFLGSVMLVYGAVARAVSVPVAMLAAAFALVFPSAAGTVFSSTMMHSNLAGLFWALALFVDSRPQPIARTATDLAVTLMLLASALSYDAFVPLFIANMLLRLRHNGLSPKGVVRAAAPLVGALGLLLLYRQILMPRLFPDSFSVLSPIERFPPAAEILPALIANVRSGLVVSFLEPLRIASLAITSLLSESFVYLAAVGSVVVVGAALLMARTARSARSAPSGPSAASATDVRKWAWQHIGLLALGALLFVGAHTIYVFSIYTPNAYGFEGRTLGAIRFTWAFLIALSLAMLSSAPLARWLRRSVAALAAVAFAVLVLTTVGQANAWVAAARYNDFLADRMSVAIRSHGLDQLPSFTLLAILPTTFPGAVYGEPILAESWDLGPALAERFPSIDIYAMGDHPTETEVTDEKVIVNSYWEAEYPLYVYPVC